MTLGRLALVILAFGIPTAIIIVGLARQASRRRGEGATLTEFPSRPPRLPNPTSWLVLSAMITAAYTFLAIGLGLGPWVIAFALDLLIVPVGLTGFQRWKASGRLGRLEKGDVVGLTVSAGFLVATVVARVL